MKKTLVALVFALTGLSSHADEALLARPEVMAYLDSVASEHGFELAGLVELFTRIEPRPNILAIFDRPSTSRPWHAFRKSHIDARRIRAGAEFWQAHAALLDTISASFRVDPAIIVAILNIETLYGRNTGSFRVLDVLATMAFDYPRRADFFRKELTEFLLLARDEKQDPLTFKGSYAGAMGWPQFMPSSFRAYTVDWDGDGRHDIWNNPADAIASVAAYMERHGWQPEGPAMIPVEVGGSAIEDLVADKFNLHYTVAELKEKGVSPLAEVDPGERAVLFPLEVAPGEMRYYLGFGNFYAITRYNKSTLYASAVLELAKTIREARENVLGEPAIAQTRPAARKTAARKPASTKTGSKKK